MNLSNKSLHCSRYPALRPCLVDTDEPCEEALLLTGDLECLEGTSDLLSRIADSRIHHASLLALGCAPDIGRGVLGKGIGGGGVLGVPSIAAYKLFCLGFCRCAVAAGTSGSGISIGELSWIASPTALPTVWPLLEPLRLASLAASAETESVRATLSPNSMRRRTSSIVTIDLACVLLDLVLSERAGMT